MEAIGMADGGDEGDVMWDGVTLKYACRRSGFLTFPYTDSVLGVLVQFG